MRSFTGSWGFGALLGLLTLVNGDGLRKRQTDEITTIFTAPVGVAYENLAIRSNGQLLITRRDTPVLSIIDPDIDNAGILAPVIIATMPSEFTGLTGITEVATDVFYVAANGNTTSAVFEVDLRTFVITEASKITSPAVVTQIATVPGAGLLNGMTTINVAEGIILIADSTLGQVWGVNVNTGNVSVAIDDPTMKIPAGSTTTFGVNGLKFFDELLYFSNTATGELNRMPIDPTTGEAVGSVVVLVSVPDIDDFTIRADDVIFACQNSIQSMLAILGTFTQVFADSSVLAGITSAAFGRTELDSQFIYAVTGGAAGVSGGTINDLDTGDFQFF